MAYRRMARGLSFSALVLALLLGTGGLTAAGGGRIALLVLAGWFAVAGVTGYVLVNSGRLPRHAGVSGPSRVRTVTATTPGRIAIGLAVVGLLLLGASIVVVPLVEGSPAEPDGTSLVLACLMSALALFVAAAIAVTIAVLSEGQDDEPDPDGHEFEGHGFDEHGFDGPGGGPASGRQRGHAGGRGPVSYRSDWITRPHR
ncbi:hypothetical protein [Tersicoccus phoenicis]|nr:hypothetical protein [Tersicoccus phoenicis]